MTQMTVVSGQVRGNGDRRSPAAQLAGTGAVLVAPPKRRTFPGQPSEVAAARRFVRRALGECPEADTAVLLTSELVTNALRHTDSSDGGTFDVIVWRGLAAACVAVVDGGSASTPAHSRQAAAPTDHTDPTETNEPTEPAESGYGLAMVDTLATRWGHLSVGGGLAVWFLLRWRTS